MKTLILYASQYGTTEKCARMLAEALPGGADLRALKGGATPDLSGYDAVVLGSSIRVGQVLKPAKQFIQNGAGALAQKKLGLFLCSGMPEDVSQQFEQNFPAPLLQHAAAKGAFGGEFLQEKMGFFAKGIVKMVSGSAGKSAPSIDEEAIKAFAAQLEAAQ